MSNFTMTTGTYTDYYNLMEKIRDQLVLAGFTIESFKVNMIGAANKGWRLHAYQGGTYIAVAGASNAKPDYLTGVDNWTTNSIKGIMVRITAASTNLSTRWDDNTVPGQLSTMQCDENNSFWIFTRGKSFILCNRFTARKYGYLNFMREVGYNGKTYQYVSGSYTGSPNYLAAYLGLPQFAFIGRSSATSGANGVTMFDTTTNTFTSQITTTNQHANGSTANSETVATTNGFLGYGIPTSTTLTNDSSIIRRTKTPFSNKYTPLPIEFFEGGFSGFTGYKRFMMQDLFVIMMDTYEAEEIFTIGSEQFIALPFLEKSATNTYTEVFGWNMGIAVKIGVV